MLNTFLTPGSEADRLPEISRYHILDTLPEQAFDDLVQVAAYLCDMPIALLALRDGERHWLKARQGLDLKEISDAQSFCRHVPNSSQLLIVPDASADPQFSDNPFVIGEPHIRFYAGAPLTAPDGTELGTLCVIDRKPRQLTLEQQNALMALSRQATAQMEMRKLVIERLQTQKMTQTILESSLDGFMRLDAVGHIQDVNDSYCRMIGFRRDELLALSLMDLEATQTQAEIVATMHQVCERKQNSFEVVHRAKNGQLVDFEVSVSYLEDAEASQGEFFCFFRAITERKKEQEALRRSESHLTAFAAFPSTPLMRLRRAFTRKKYRAG